MPVHLFAMLATLIVGLLPLAAHAPLIAINPPLLESPKATILFAGDMMFDRSVRLVAEKHGGDFLFSCIDDVLRSTDLVIANLEGPITPYPSMSVSSTIGSPENITFTFPTTTAELLARHNIHLVNIGNNHIMNFGRDGLIQTKQWLKRASVAYMGDPDSSESERVARMEINKIPFSFVNWSDWTSDKTDHTVQQVRKGMKAGRITVVYAHWGEEYATTSLPRVKQLAHSFVDVGAALVVGSHPHVVQEHEVYRGKDIYYSLGNFIFDQYWNEDVRIGLLLRVTFDSDGVRQIEKIPIYLERDRRACPHTN